MTIMAKNKIIARTERLDDMKLQGFHAAKEATVKKQPTEWETLFDSYLPDSRLILKTKI